LMSVPFAIEKKLYVIIQNGQLFTAELKAYSPPITPTSGRQAGKVYEQLGDIEIKMESGKDVAVLKIEAKNLPTAKLGNSENVRLTDQVYAVGFPGVVLQHSLLGQQTILDPTVTSGKVSGVKLQVGGAPVIQTDAPLTWGNSGGPVFNRNGEVIGMATFISLKENIPIQGFNFLVPSNTIMEFVRVSGANLQQESVFNKLWYEAIDLYTKGEYQKAMSKLDDVLRLYPFLPDARNLQVKIQEKLSAGEGSSKAHPIVFAVVALGLVIVGGGLGFVLLRSKRGSAAVGVKKETFIGKLIGVGGQVVGQTYSIPPQGIKIGRDPSKNNIVIKDDRVSREHAWIGLADNQVVIRDLNSANGTFVNGVQVSERVLKDGDSISIGKDFAVFNFKSA
ncbi:MAG: trypsin-like peptidase domain-containing protein, partial [Hydrogenobacter thermophilus]|nr:trypsin-like peptidase domain-containing protein [Hydrogenobacter thermophilus]